MTTLGHNYFVKKESSNYLSSSSVQSFRGPIIMLKLLTCNKDNTNSEIPCEFAVDLKGTRVVNGNLIFDYKPNFLPPKFVCNLIQHNKYMTTSRGHGEEVFSCCLLKLINLESISLMYLLQIVRNEYMFQC